MNHDEPSFGTGPEVGATPPDFDLPDQSGEIVSYSAMRGGGKAIILFYRSASW